MIKYEKNNIDNTDNYLLASAWLERFEIPLTMSQTDSVFEVIQSVKYGKYIQSVYLPLYGFDGFSGRPFFKKNNAQGLTTVPGYQKTKKEWVTLIKEIAQYKPVVLTVPFSRNIDLIKEYIDYGIKEIMVNYYWPGLDQLKSKIKISRSILAHHDSGDPIDERFDAVVIPYRKTMDLQWLEENSKKYELVAIINNYCVIDCPMKKHKEDLMHNFLKGIPPGNNEIMPFTPACLRYGKTISAMLPREIVWRLRKYISRYKLVERASSPAAYINSLNYYIYNESFVFDNYNPEDLVREGLTAKKMAMIMKDKEDHFRGSNLETLNCKFQCAECQRKCFSIADWNNIQV